MIRWAVVLSIVVATAAALAGTYGYDPKASGPIMDELLVYEISPRDAVTAKLPAGVSTLLLTLWAALPRGVPVDPQGFYEYGVKVELSTPQGTVQGVRHYGTVSRVTVGSPGSEAFSARLADSDRAVTDPRTIEVDTSAIAARGGEVRVRAEQGRHPQLLARLSYRFERGPLEQRLLERSLGPEDYRSLLAETTALGFVDLAPHARKTALQSWSRRLTADGQKGKDYRVRRLLVGDHRALGDAAPPRVLDVQLLPHRMAVLNLQGPTQVRVVGAPGLELRVREGEQAERAAFIPREGYLDMLFSEQGLRSVFFACAEPARVRFGLRPEQLDAQVGDVERVVYPDGLVQIAPDVRKHAYYRLDPAIPLRYRVAPQQGPFRVQLRALLDATAPPAALTGRVWADWQDAAGKLHSAELQVPLVRSIFESFGDYGHASDSHVLYVHPPPGAHAVGLRGERNLALSAAVAEPGVEQSELELPYAGVTLSPALQWKYAPYALSRWSTVRPIGAGELAVESRLLKLQAQVRLEPHLVPVPGSLPQHGLWPLGTPVRRQLLVQRPLSELEPDDRPLFELPSEARVRVEASGPRARRIRVRFHAGPEQLGGTLRIRLDGELVEQRTLVVRSGQLDLVAQPGVRRLSVEGLGDGGVAYVDARPLGATHFVKQSAMAELSRNRRLSFQTPGGEGEAYSLVLFVATQGSSLPVALHYEVDGGRPRQRQGVFFRYASQPAGVLEAVSGDFERGVLLEAERQAAPRASAELDGVSRLRIRLGDDLASPRHRVTLRLPKSGGPDRVWVRAVLVGEAAPEESESHRAWISEAD